MFQIFTRLKITNEQLNMLKYVTCLSVLILCICMLMNHI